MKKRKKDKRRNLCRKVFNPSYVVIIISWLVYIVKRLCKNVLAGSKHQRHAAKTLETASPAKELRRETKNRDNVIVQKVKTAAAC